MKLSTQIMIGNLAIATSQCFDPSTYYKTTHGPFSSGAYKLSYMRPDASCRTVTDPQVEDTITKFESIIADPDLYRLFYNSFPNTLDTAVKWMGHAANNSDEELAFLITGDINAMWLRDSANQMQSYTSFLSNSTTTSSTQSKGSRSVHQPRFSLANSTSNSTDMIAKLHRGVINLQTRFVNSAPFCNSFQPPPESGLAPDHSNANDNVKPAVDHDVVFECKYELDSLAAFLEISHNYYYGTNDLEFFGKFQWVAAVQTVLNTAKAMMTPTYNPDGSVATSPYTWNRQTDSATETQDNSGRGNPVKGGIGLVRSFFRPSDDATIFQYFVPANMMFSRYLGSTAAIMSGLGHADLASEMTSLSNSIRAAITKYALVSDPDHGSIYAYEIDGFGGRNMMDDANIPSLLSMPVFGYVGDSKLYEATRNKLLSADNPYYMRGPVINAIGGPHAGEGQAWPMASIVRILTSHNETEVYTSLKEIVSSTAGLGLIHESVNSFDQTNWTRQWFSWANGLFGQMILDVYQRYPDVLKKSFQP